MPDLPSVRAPDTEPSTAIHTLLGRAAINAIESGCAPKTRWQRENIKAIKKLKISRSYVSRIEKKAIERLREGLAEDEQENLQ